MLRRLAKGAVAAALSRALLPPALAGPQAVTAVSGSQQLARYAVGGKHGIDAEIRNSALQSALKNIETTFGSGTVMRLGGESGINREVAVIPTGSMALNAALGIGGLPRGRVVEIYGPEASGKTTLALHCVAETQKRGGTAVYIDAEHALDGNYVAALGVDTNALLISQPDSGEQALSVADMFVRSASVDLVVIDSVAALVPKAELEGDIGDPHMALQARLMSQALRKMTHEVSKTNTTLLFINQIRNKIGGFGGFGGAPEEVTSGGRALKFYASVRLDVRRISQVKKGDEVCGAMLRIKVVKNKLAPPLRVVEMELEYGRGLSREAELLDLGVREGLLTRHGAWFRKVNEKENFANGRDRAKQFLRDNPSFATELATELEHRLRTTGRFATLRGGAGAAAEDADPEAGD